MRGNFKPIEKKGVKLVRNGLEGRGVVGYVGGGGVGVVGSEMGGGVGREPYAHLWGTRVLEPTNVCHQKLYFGTTLWHQPKYLHGNF